MPSPVLPPPRAEERALAAPPAWHLLLLLVLPAACYANSLGVPFALDDDTSIVVNPGLTTWGAAQVAPPSRWLGYLTLKLNYLAGGLDPTGYHAVNVAIHVLAGLAVYALARRLLRLRAAPEAASAWADHAALVGALVFLLHPIQTQAVTYVVQRLASLATLLYATALLLYVIARTTASPATRRAAFAGGAAAAVGAMFTKEIAFTLPFAIALVELSFLPAPTRRRAPLFASLLALTLVIPVSWALSGQSVGSASAAGSTASRLEYAATQARVVPQYLRLLVWPVGQNLDHDVPLEHGFASPGVLLRLALLASLAAAAVALLTRARATGLRLAGLGVLLLFLGLSVESSIVPIEDVMFEHRLYLPMLGVALAVAGAFDAATAASRRARRWLPAGAAIGLAALAAATVARNHVWRSPVALWSDVVEKSPRKPRAHYNLGNALRDAGDLEGARREWLAAVGLDPRYSFACNQLGSLALVGGDLAGAERWYRCAIAGRPANAEASYNLAQLLEATGRADEAVEHYRRFVETAPAFLGDVVERVRQRFGWRGR